MKKLEEESGMGGVILSIERLEHLEGGRLWPFFDFQEIFSRIYYGEDLVFIDLIKKD